MTNVKACLMVIALMVTLGSCSSAPGPTTVGNAPPDYAAGDTLLPHEEFTIESRVMNEARPINVYFPPGYEESADETYPVLYMPDGGVNEDFPHLTYTVDAGIRAGKIRPIVVVGIQNTQRRRDMTGPTEVDNDRTVAPVVGGSAAFRAFIRDELMPEIEKKVRGNGRTAIIGESLAGLFIVETLFLDPEMFDIYIAIDPSLWWNDGEFFKTADRLSSGHCECTLYLTTAGKVGHGNIEFVDPLARAIESNAPAGLRLVYEPMSNEEHSTIYRASKQQILERFFPPIN